MTPLGVATALWVIWALSWLLAATWSSRPHSRAGLISQLPYRLITTAGFRVIQTGPYGIVRHPIYTGIILAAVTIAILKASLYALIGAFLIVGMKRSMSSTARRLTLLSLPRAGMEAMVSHFPRP